MLPSRFFKYAILRSPFTNILIEIKGYVVEFIIHWKSNSSGFYKGVLVKIGITKHTKLINAITLSGKVSYLG